MYGLVGGTFCSPRHNEHSLKILSKSDKNSLSYLGNRETINSFSRIEKITIIRKKRNFGEFWAKNVEKNGGKLKKFTWFVTYIICTCENYISTKFNIFWTIFLCMMMAYLAYMNYQESPGEGGVITHWLQHAYLNFTTKNDGKSIRVDKVISIDPKKIRFTKSGNIVFSIL